jgi:hypothetical protein
MERTFILVTNQPSFAVEAEGAGIHRVLVDLERRGKAARQRGRRLFLSEHSCSDIAKLRQGLRRTAVMARVDPWSNATTEQVRAVLDGGAQALMLPMTTSAWEAEAFVRAVNARALVSILIETREGVDKVDEIARVGGVDELHFGLNDLAISYGCESILDILVARRLDTAAAVARNLGRPFGVGGVTDPQQEGLMIPPNIVLGEQARLGTSIFWLGRSFRQQARGASGMVDVTERIRRRLQDWDTVSEDLLDENHAAMARRLQLRDAQPLTRLRD